MARSTTLPPSLLSAKPKKGAPQLGMTRGHAYFALMGGAEDDGNVAVAEWPPWRRALGPLRARPKLRPPT